MGEINFAAIEKKWQDRWAKKKVFESAKGEGDKFYVLEMFPYPSSDGLHMGHALNYSIGDVLARFKRMNGFDVLYPMGFDALGLPAENAAIKAEAHPKVFTEKAIANYTRQMKELGLSYDWSKTLSTMDPEYYKWNQYFFLKFLEAGLIYKKKAAVNWCPSCNTVISNEQAQGGICERCKSKIEVRHLDEWFMRTTKYADELLGGLDQVDWPDKIKAMQVNWIGKSHGTEIAFEVENETRDYEKDKKTILVDAINAFVIKGKGIFSEMYDLLETFSNKKIILTNANDEEVKKFGLENMPYEVFTLKHSPDKTNPEYYKKMLENFNLKAEGVMYFEHNKDAVKSAQSIGIKTFYYDKDKKDIKSLKNFIEKNCNKTWKIFTTRPDTIFGVTFMVVSAQHPRLDELVTVGQRVEVKKFLKKLGSTSEKELASLEKEGVFSGSYAINPATDERVPIWIGNFVVADYGAGMVMAVPAHDQRDYEFAKKYGIPVKCVIEPITGKKNSVEKHKRSIVALVKNPKDGKILTLDWGEKFGGKLLVGGTLEDGEDFIDCAKREIAEETGYKNVKFVDKTEIVHHYYFAYSKNKEKYIEAVGLLFELGGEERVEQKLEEHENGKIEVKWCTKDELAVEIQDSLHRFVFDRFVNGRIWTDNGIMINSGHFDGMDSVDAVGRITDWLIEKGAGKRVVNYKLRDWGFSRQRYWGTPIPIINCEQCGAVPVPERDLPVVLPENVEFGKGNPLETNEEWLNVVCPGCGNMGRRESETMDTFVDSSWYFLRYPDNKNKKAPFSKQRMNDWLPVNQYIGGAEHACLHLIYARFFTKALRDLGFLEFDEPFMKLFNQGMLHGPDGDKMSKSKGNVINPDEVSKKYGMDTARYFLLSLAAPDKPRDWSEKGIMGSLRFVRKIFDIFERVKIGKSSAEFESLLHSIIRDASVDYDDFQYRRVTIMLKDLFDSLAVQERVARRDLEACLKLLSPICPHIAEELWEKLGNKDFISLSSWPKVNLKKILKKGVAGDLNGKIVERVKEIAKKETKRVYLYVIPSEFGKVDVEKISKATGKRVEAFAVSDGDKYDPKGMAKRAKPGMPGIWLE